EALVALGFFSGFFGVHVFIRVDRGAIHDALFDVDRHAEPAGQHDRVAGARVELLCLPVALDDNPRKERVVALVVDHDLRHMTSRTASAIAWLGRESISWVRPSRSTTIRAKKVSLRRSLTTMWCTCPPNSVMTDLSRSWVSGRSTSTFWSLTAIASASKGPIKIGR